MAVAGRRAAEGFRVVVYGLSETSTPLVTGRTQILDDDLADRAGVSARTIRNYRYRLEAFNLIQFDETGYHLARSFQTTSEHRDSFVPTVLEENQTLLDAADAFLETILPPERYGEPDGPLGSVLFWPPDPQRYSITTELDRSCD